jgi:hypothetical protein
MRPDLPAAREAYQFRADGPFEYTPRRKCELRNQRAHIEDGDTGRAEVREDGLAEWEQNHACKKNEHESLGIR